MVRYLLLSTAQREHVAFTTDRGLASNLYRSRERQGEDVALYEVDGQDRKLLRETPGYAEHRQKVGVPS